MLRLSWRCVLSEIEFVSHTFRAEKTLIDALKLKAEKEGLSINRAFVEIAAAQLIAEGYLADSYQHPPERRGGYRHGTRKKSAGQ